ncbi:unnamed protein product [Dibothriocephalus latus]|uniref:Uncharacterized protein n=1 Tax=Dibothriocephalus latus TaxID=60516 RepID=A0A3P7NNR5_DIBLA|nr:unnamed protein product [Dibothriocephalus latus]
MHRQGVLSLHKPWSLNFTAWFINSLAFCVENRTEHLALRWGDFRLGRCQETSTEYLCFYNRVSQQVYFLCADPTPSSTTDAATAAGPETLCPCPVQPRSLACNKANDIDLCQVPGPWFTEHSWGKNKLGGLLAEAAKIAGLPVIWLPKRRSYRKGTTTTSGGGGAVYASFSAQKRPAPTPPSQPKQARTGPEILPPSSMQWTSPYSVATVVSPPSTLVPLDIDADGAEADGQMVGEFPPEQVVPQAKANFLPNSHRSVSKSVKDHSHNLIPYAIYLPTFPWLDAVLYNIYSPLTCQVLDFLPSFLQIYYLFFRMFFPDAVILYSASEHFLASQVRFLTRCHSET